MAAYEVFIKCLFPSFYKVRFYRYLFPAVAMAILALALLTAVLSPDQPWKFVGVADRVLVFIQLISLGFFTFLMIMMGREWTRHEFAIVFGFGIVEAASLFTSVMWVKNGDKNSLVSYLPTIAWDIACVIWLIAFGKAEKSRQQEESSSPINSEILQEARKWEGSLKSWLAPPKKRQ